MDQLSFVIRGSKGALRPSAPLGGGGGFYYHFGPGNTGRGRMSSVGWTEVHKPKARAIGVYVKTGVLLMTSRSFG